MKAHFGKNVSITLENTILCSDVSQHIEDMVREKDFNTFKLELLNSVYTHYGLWGIINCGQTCLNPVFVD